MYFNVKLTHMGVSEKKGKLAIIPVNRQSVQQGKSKLNMIDQLSLVPYFQQCLKNPAWSVSTGWSMEFPIHFMQRDNTQYVG